MSRILVRLVTGILALQNLVFATGEYFSESGYLTRHENEWIQAVCGHKPGVKPVHKLLNSDDASVTDAPWAVTLLNDKRESLCSGVLISHRHVLTAAHCLQRNNLKVDLDHEENPPKRKTMVLLETASPNIFRVVLGDNCGKNSQSCRENTTGTREVVKVRRFWIHSNFNRNKTSDLAILELATTVKSNRNIMPICLADGPLTINQSLHIYGSGKDGQSWNKVYKLQHISVKVVDCLLDANMHTIPIGAKDFCTLSRDMKKRQTSCAGDSGSGVVAGPDKSDKVHLYGIVSRGSTCKVGPHSQIRDFVDYHTLIYPYIGWIARKTGVCPTGHSCENEPRRLESDVDGEMIENGKTQTLYCEDETWLLSVAGTNALCYKVPWWTDGNINVTSSEKKCQEISNAQLAPVRNLAELIALRDAVVKSEYEMERYTETYVPVGGFWNVRANTFKWNLDRSEALKYDGRIHLWAGEGNSIDRNGHETHCMAVRFLYDVPLLTEISCEYGTDVVACAKAPERRTVVSPA